MRFLKLIIFALSLSSLALAAKVPNCWDTTNEHVTDGEFLIHFEPAQVSIDTVQAALVAPNLKLTNQINLGKGQLWTVSALNPNGLSRNDLIQAVTQQLQAVADIPNVDVECDAVFHLAM